VSDLIAIIEQATGRMPAIEHIEGLPGDVREAHADISRAARFRLRSARRARTRHPALRRMALALPRALSDRAY
jgi:hypothetical protein